MIDIEKLKFDKDGLIPAVVTDFYSKKVLTVAYMNKESLQISIDEGKTCFYSRSRKCLWRKGETSGNFQHIVNIVADCDFDALTVEVIKDGPACHLGTDSCFTNVLYKNEKVNDFSLQGLYELLQGRNTQRPQGSYTTYLFEQGIDKILKKVGEECTEVIVAGKGGDKAETVFEIADLTYHVLVLMVQMGISVEDVFTELSKRHVIDHKVKQQKMQ
jgi:phosphoribosyl-ATP pyrophosphohydrolase/phosphoribosyl-AMP cyclohydrolase